MQLSAPIRAVCFDWGGTLMSEVGPQDTSMANWPSVEVIAGAKECVARLHGRYPLCIATNATISHHRDIRRALERGGLAHYFQEIFCFMDLGFKKNQKGFWSAVQSRLALPTREIAMVGDSLEHDAVAPRGFGVQAVWFNPVGAVAQTEGAEVPTVKELNEFAQLVESAA